MSIRRSLINLESVSLCLIILMASTLWFFEDILNMHFLVFGIMMLSMSFILVRKVKFVRFSNVLLLFGLSILISIGIKGATLRIIYRATVFILLLLYSVMADFKINTLFKARKFLVFCGVFTSVTIIAQFLLGNTFNSIYYRMMKSTAQTEAMFYATRGYYAGLFTKPHDAAALVSFAIVALLIEKWDTASKKQMIIPLLMFIPLLLTGKRAIIVLVVVALFILRTLAQLAKKRWLNVLAMVVGIGVLAYVAIWYIGRSQNNVLFTRFYSLINGETSLFDNTRWRLWSDAWNLWTENPIFGIGWEQFAGLTTSKLSYSRSHNVNMDYLQMLCETGIVGFILMITPIMCMFKRAISLCRYVVKTGSFAQQRNIILFAVYIQIFILMYALIEVPFYSITYFTFYILSCIIINTFYPSFRRQKTLLKNRLLVGGRRI
ncbi:MAG: O-antigen ligase family protein [Clostridia bacterium]|nr:O-antigen ligase family protein [Clostridia bacterium]